MEVQKIASFLPDLLWFRLAVNTHPICSGVTMLPDTWSLYCLDLLEEHSLELSFELFYPIR